MSTELLLPAAFLAGLFGSAHCIGMCGAIVILFEERGAAAVSPWLRRALYNGGRLGLYAVLGAVAGAGGAVLTKVAGVNAGLMILRLVAGVLVIAIGVNLLANWSATRFLEQAGAGIWRRLSPLARHVLPVSTAPRAIAAGFLWGALPCGLVYSAVAIAAASGGALYGALIMLTFWLGTVPTLVLAGAAAERVGRLKSNSSLRSVGGTVMVVIGMLALIPATKSLIASL